MEFRQSSKLSEVCYEIRGPVIEHANALEEAGHSVLRLNTGNPALFGFEAPEEILQDMIRMLPRAHGYTDSRGVLSARRAVAQRYQTLGLEVDVDDVFLGNGVSELVSMAVQALIEDGDEILIPAPDFPLWTAVTTLAGGKAVHYLCDEQADWYPDLDDMASKITDRTRAVVIINPNNPTGAVYPKEIIEGILDLARRHGLMVFADEIYDQILYDDAVFQPVAPLAGDHPCLTFSGLSKVHRACGWRVGWAHLSGDDARLGDFRAALDLLGALRLCANVPGQYAIDAAVNGPDTISELCTPGGRLYETRRAVIEACEASEHLSLVAPAGALYAFPAVVGAAAKGFDDHNFALDLMNNEGVLVVPGSSFNVPYRHHFRVTLLPEASVMRDVFARIDRVLARRAEDATKVVPLKPRRSVA